MYFQSSRCRYRDFLQPFYLEWCERFMQHPILHRKQWEYVFIAEALRERGMLKPGQRGLAFGAGHEVLPIVFATMGCEITATDLTPWAPSRDSLLSTSALAANVSTAVVDMRQIPMELVDFDFVWSACAFEHLGSQMLGVEFVAETLRCLKPGGWSVHTTELNIDRSPRELRAGPTVFYRAADLQQIAQLCGARGRMEPLDIAPGEHAFDRFVDAFPYPGSGASCAVWRDGAFSGPAAHISLNAAGLDVTSVGVLVQRQ